MSTLNDRLLWEAMIHHKKRPHKKIMVKIYRSWSKKLKEPVYTGWIGFPDRTYDLPETPDLKHMQRVIHKKLIDRGYAGENAYDIQPELSYHGWEDEDALVNDPLYDVDRHMRMSAFNHAFQDLTKTVDDVEAAGMDIAPPEEIKSLQTPQGVLHVGDNVQLIKDLRNDERWRGNPPTHLPRVGTHGKITFISTPNEHVTYKVPNIQVQFKGFRDSPYVIDPSFVKKIGLGSFGS
jgi:hypothetical protein